MEAQKFSTASPSRKLHYTNVYPPPPSVAFEQVPLARYPRPLPTLKHPKFASWGLFHEATSACKSQVTSARSHKLQHGDGFVRLR